MTLRPSQNFSLHMPTWERPTFDRGMFFSREPMDFEPVDTHLWRLKAAWEFRYFYRRFTIPAGFTTDFYTLPAVARLFFPVIPGRLSIAAVIHDYLVRYRKDLGIGLVFAHGALREAMIELGHPYRAQLFYAAVFCFNWIAPGPGTLEPHARTMRKARARMRGRYMRRR